MPEDTQKYFYQLSAQQAVESLQTDAEKGLTAQEAESRLAEHGPNELQAGKRRPMIFRFLDQFKDLLIIVLIIAALLAYYLGDFRGGTILLVIVLVNALIGFYQEFKAEKILESLKKIIQDSATVIRDGKKQEVEQKNLVPGDLVYLEEGSAIPADVRLLRGTHFTTNDFILTGESVPQEKFPAMVIDKVVTISNQDNSVFMGTTVAKGNAYGLVYGTGMNTAIGRIATASQKIEHGSSPLQIEINSLAKMLTKIAGVIALILFVINLSLSLRGGEPMGPAVQLSILFAISVAAASVPQGLPAQISVALSLGVGRMAKKKAIVKKLSAVETLGSTTVICSDKTGTLTQNQMTITHAFTQGRLFEIGGSGYEPTGEIKENGKPIEASHLELIKQFFQDGFLASHGRALPPDEKHAHWYPVGDPTEVAFTPLAIKAGLDLKQLEELFPLGHEVPFDSNRKRMTMVREHKGKHIGYMKGGLESVLSVCTQTHENGKLVPLTEKMKQKALKHGEEFAKQALRVIALGYRDFEEAPQPDAKPEAVEQQFVFAGFVAMIDPPRPAVSSAVKAAYDASIRIIMITGDNATTAKAIAQRIGMGAGSLDVDLMNKQTSEGHFDAKQAVLRRVSPPAYTGDEVKEMSDDKLKKILKSQSAIFSRVSPEDKFRIVSLLKEQGEVVAVTGDGVNDTLSLKKADIGVSMGLVGSEVAKEASEMVLLDDDFGTLVLAVREGRTIFQNLKKTILSSITSNNGELTCVLLGFVGIALGLPAPITAVQILAIDLVGEMLPLTALTFDPPEEGLMKQPPRDMKEHIINRRSFLNVLFYGFWMGAAGYFSFFMIQHLGGSLESAQAGAYVGIILCQFINILSRRTSRTLFTPYLFKNPYLWGSFAISLVAISLLIYVPGIAVWFGFDALSLSHWLYPVIGMVVFLFWHEAGKGILRKKKINH